MQGTSDPRCVAFAEASGTSSSEMPRAREGSLCQRKVYLNRQEGSQCVIDERNALLHPSRVFTKHLQISPGGAVSSLGIMQIPNPSPADALAVSGMLFPLWKIAFPHHCAEEGCSGVKLLSFRSSRC
jgi:hypothetical protein